MMKNKKKIMGLLLLLMVIAAFIIYFQTSNDELEKITVRLGWVHQGQFAGFYMAKEKGFYQEQGLEVDFLELDDLKNQVKELEEGEIDFSVMEAHQALVGLDQGVPLKALMAIYQVNPHSLAVRADSDIYEPSDFMDKTIGLAGGEGEGSALFKIFISQYDESNSVKYKQLQFDTINDFINKEADVIDIYRIDQPYLAEKKGVPLRIIPLDAYGFSTYGDIVVAHQSLIDENPELVRRFIQATAKGWEYALENQRESIEVTLGYTKGDYKDPEYQRYIIQQSAPLIKGVNKIGLMNFVSWSTLYESMKSVGAITADLDVPSIYTNEFLN